MTISRNVIPFTADAYAALQNQHASLQQSEKEVLVRLQQAREMGDLSENGAYKYAKIELGTIRRELRRIRFLLQRGQVTRKHQGNTAGFGSVITVEKNKQQMQFTLVSQYESDPSQQKLSLESPLGSAVYGKKVGDAVIIETPSGSSSYQILNIS